MRKRAILRFLLFVSGTLPIGAQDEHKGDHNMADNTPPMKMVDMNPAGMFLLKMSSGTAANPASWPMPMWMKHFGSWNTMFMAQAFVVQTTQSGPRGGDKFYSANWFMASAEHRVGELGSF